MRNFKSLDIISIEIGVECNLRHLHEKCPANVRIINKEFGALTNEDIVKVIREVYDNGFNGEIGFHYYNEPCLYKKQMFEIMAECPFAKFLLWTNGDLLDPNIDNNEFLKKFHNIVISNYGGRERYAYYAKLQKAYPNIVRIIDYQTIDDLDNRKTIYENEPSNTFGCVRPFHIELPIDCYGNVHLCCRDYNNSCVIGNVKTQSILNIIRSETYRSCENSIKQPLLDLKTCPDVCKRCDAPDKFPTFTVKLKKIVRQALQALNKFGDKVHINCYRK